MGAAAIPGGSDADLGVGVDVNWRDLDSDRGITKSNHGRADQRKGGGRGVMKSRERPNNTVNGAGWRGGWNSVAR